MAYCHSRNITPISTTYSKISLHQGGASVTFLDGGYMEVETATPATTQSSGWTATQLDDGGTLFSKYGAASALIISYGE